MKKTSLWDAIERDGFRVYDGFIDFIKYHYAPHDNKLAYKIEDTVNSWMVDMMADLDSKYGQINK